MAMQLRAFRAASTFDGVANLYLSLTPWRGGNEYGTQHTEGESRYIENYEKAFSLSPHMKRYVTLRPVKYGYAARYHGTDVVTWTRQRDQAGVQVDSVYVHAFQSISTESFANDFTPSNLRFKFHLDDGHFVRVSNKQHRQGWYYDDNDVARCYEFPANSNIMKFDVMDGLAVPVDPATTAFIDPRSPMMSVALKNTNYHDFMAWARARLAFHIGPITYPKSPWHPQIDALALLADPNKWETILFSRSFASERTTYSHIALIEGIGDHLRSAIYRAAKAVTVRQVEWYPWSQFDNQRKLRNRYPWAVY